MMKKLGIVCALMLACGAASAAAVGDSSVTLQINNVTVPPMGTQPIPLSQLFPSKPYMVACVIQDPNYAANQAVIGPSFTGNGPVVVTYALNGTAFSNSARLSASSLNNTFLATGVENLTAGPGPGASSTLNIGNEDQSDKIVIVSCVATPVLSTK